MRPDLLELLRCPASGTALTLDVLERDGDDVLYGVLRSEAGEYPVVGGVPVLAPHPDRTVALLRAGLLPEAAAAALAGQIAPSRLGRLAAALDLLPRGATAARLLGDRDRRRLSAALAPLLDAGAPDPLALIRLGFGGWGAANPDGVDYFTYRFGTPRHLVALAVVDAVADPGGRPVLDLGCGAGHLTWGLAQRFGGAATVGLDLSLFELWAARGVAGPGHFVCADATALPLRAASFGFVIASDVLSFVRHKWGVAHEALRVLAPDGTLAVTSVKSALHGHVYAGMPLPPAGWCALVGDAPHRLFADDRILERYFAREGLSLDDTGRVDDAPTVTLLAGHREPRLRPAPAPGRWAHAVGPLGVNPLLRLSEYSGDRIVYRRHFPSDRFAADNPPLGDYLPGEASVLRAAIADGQLERTLVEDLVATTAVLALPDAYRRAQHPLAVPPAVGPA